MTTRSLRSALHPSDPLAPLAWLIIPLPLWWALGLANLGYLLIAIPMGVSLLRRRRLTLPPAFGWWLAFLLWLVLSTTMLGLNPPGTLVETATSRLPIVGFRFAEYGAATVMLIWATNLDPLLVPAGRFGRLLGVLLAWTVAGGFLGALAPAFEFTSLVESIVPNAIASNSYVSAMIHPAAAQIQDVIGTDNGRPSAPYPFTNSWGNALAMLIPFGVAAALMARTQAARLRWIVLVAVSLVPTILSLNRGLWIGLILGVGFVVARLIATRRFVALTLVVSLGVALLLAILVSPLGEVARQRNSGDAPSDNIRSFSISRSVEVARASPVLGYGGTRAQEGSSSTIAVGKSAACATCGNQPLGTNGQLWFVLVGQGFVGVIFYLGFHLALLRRFLHSRHVVATTAAAVTVLSLWFSLIYDRTVATGCIEFLAIAAGVIALREPDRHRQT